MPATLRPVRVNVFPGGFNWPLYVAQDRGMFTRRGIAVTVEGTPNSVAQMTDFAAGRFDIAMTAFDNIVAYVDGQGQAPIGPQPDFVAVMSSDSGFLSLVTTAEVSLIKDLRGRRLSVDAISTGFAFVLYEMLRRRGLDKDKGDVTIESAGGMMQRWTALREGRHAGTLLSAPYNLIAQAEGFREQARAVEALGPYQGNVAAVLRPWAAANPDAASAYIGGYREAVDWLYQPGHRDEALSILTRNVPGLSGVVSGQTHAELLHPKFGFFQNGQFDPAAIEHVLALRARYTDTGQQQSQRVAERYCDDRFLNASS